MVELSEHQENLRDLKRRFSPMNAVAGIAFAISYLVARLWLERPTLDHTTRILFALLPLPFVLFFTWQQLRSMDRMDEMERKIMHRASNIALHLTVALLLTLAMFERAVGLNPADFTFDRIWFMPWLVQMVIFVVMFKRYRAG